VWKNLGRILSNANHCNGRAFVTKPGRRSVLVLEDDGAFAAYVCTFLTLREHEVYWAGNIHEATRFLEERSVDFIIADLCMDPRYLPDEYREEAEYGVLTGWVWLERIVFARWPNMIPRIAVLSGYLQHCENLDFRSSNGIPLIDKRDPCAPTKILCLIERPVP